MSDQVCAGCGLRLHRYSPNDPDHDTDLMACVNSMRGEVERRDRRIDELTESNYRLAENASEQTRELRQVGSAVAAMFANMEHGDAVRSTWFAGDGWRKRLARLAMLHDREDEG